jgi:hypothetical protein
MPSRQLHTYRMRACLHGRLLDSPLTCCACLPPPVCLQARVQLQLQRTCGCQDDEECDECEGVRVTMSNASNLPLVTTPGPRPKLLTLDDLNLAGEGAGPLML